MEIRRFVCNDFQENCYVVSDETKEGIIVDCGAFFPEERKAIVDYVRKNGITLRHLICTHGHLDHIFGNETIYSEFGILPELHEDDAIFIKEIDQQIKAFYGKPLNVSAPPIGRLFSDGDIIKFGSHEIQVISTPGHSPGSVIFYCNDEKIAFSGDTLFRMSIGRTDFKGGNYDSMFQSLRRLPHLIDTDSAILPGHGPETKLSEELRFNPYMRLCP